MQQAYIAHGLPEWNRISTSEVPGNLFSISGSADGQRLVAVATGMWTRSEDYGETWTQIPDSTLFTPSSVRCDATGMTCVTTTIYGVSFARGSIYRSVDGGATWAVVVDKVGQFRDVTCDPTGTKWFAVLNSRPGGQNGFIYKSVDSGATWNTIPGSDLTFWSTVACDETFLKCTAAASEIFNGDPGSIYVTDDGFQTISLVPNSPSGIFWDSAVSADGQQMIVVQYESDDDGPRTRGLIWRSSDGGTTRIMFRVCFVFWTMMNDRHIMKPTPILPRPTGNSFQRMDAPSRYYYGVSCDAAFHMCAAAPNGQGANYDASLMLVSCDGGLTWNETPGAAKYWTSVKVNADGGLMTSVEQWGPSFAYSYPLPIA